MTGHPRKLVLAVVLLPVVYFAYWVGTLYYQEASGHKVHFRVQGYDPRNLLSGHYLAFRVAYDQPLCKNSENAEYCVCLQDADIARVEWHGPCEQRPDTCQLFLHGACRNSQFLAGIERYYLPETKQGLTIGQDDQAFITVVIDSMGRGWLQSLTVNGLAY